MISNSNFQTNTTSAFVTQWVNMPANETGAPRACSQYVDKSAHVVGVLDGATVSIEGSHDGVNWAPLTDVLGNTLSFTTSNRIKQIAEITQFVRPVVTGGGASADVTVYILFKE